MTKCFKNILSFNVLHLGAVNRRLISFENHPTLLQLWPQGFLKIVLVNHLPHMKFCALKTVYN